MRRVARLRALSILVGVVAMLTLAPMSARAVVITQHPLPAGDSPATSIFGWAGGLITAGASVGGYQRVQTAPSITVTPGVALLEAVGFGPGPGGVPWFVGGTKEKIGTEELVFPVLLEVTPTGAVPKFKYPGAFGRPYSPLSLATGPDGAIWIADPGAGIIERYAPSGDFNQFPMPHRASVPITIVNGPNNEMWFTAASDAVGEINMNGEITEYALPVGDAFGPGALPSPYGIAVGPDGAVWFTEENTGRIGRMTASGELTVFNIPNPSQIPPESAGGPSPRDIVAGPDGSMWFTDPGDESIGRVTLAGEITEYPIPAQGASVVPEGIVVADGELWFAEGNAKALGSVNPSAVAASATRPLAAKGGRRAATARRSCKGSSKPEARAPERSSGQKASCQRAASHKRRQR